MSQAESKINKFSKACNNNLVIVDEQLNKLRYKKSAVGTVKKIKFCFFVRTLTILIRVIEKVSRVYGPND